MVLMLAAGVTLLGVILYYTDLGEVWSRLQQMGWRGMAAFLAVHVLGFSGLALSWLLALPSKPVTPRWMYRFWKVMMVGAALEAVTPLAGLGGEPVKAVLVKRHYGISFKDASASLMATRTTDLMAQVVFLVIGFSLMFQAALLPLPYRITAGVGLALFCVSILLFFLMQSQRAFSRTRSWLERGWLSGREMSAKAIHALDSIHAVEDRLLTFYSSKHLRMILSILAAFCEWMCAAIATWIAIRFLGHPISFADAIVIEAFVTLVRSTLFFVPADIGTQDGAQVLICSVLTGSPELGVALAAVRRARDLVWVAWGLAIGSAYSLGGVGELRRLARATVEEAEGL
jgi:uncharacterized protein (TIRG00374 family)